MRDRTIASVVYGCGARGWSWRRAALTTGTTTTALVQEQAMPPVTRGDRVAWGCEAVGTLAMLFVGFSTVALVNAHSSPLRSHLVPAGLRYALIGIGFGLAVAAVVVSPIG